MHLVGGGVQTCASSSNWKDNMTLCRDTMLPCLELIPPSSILTIGCVCVCVRTYVRDGNGNGSRMCVLLDVL